MTAKTIRLNDEEKEILRWSLQLRINNMYCKINELKRCLDRSNDYTDDELDIIKERLEYAKIKLPKLEKLYKKITGDKYD